MGYRDSLGFRTPTGLQLASAKEERWHDDAFAASCPARISTMHVLGSGGFADVFLYEQNMPRRQVAVKVMLSEVVNDQVRQMFQAEAKPWRNSELATSILICLPGERLFPMDGRTS
jgi:hypothetical protein